MSVREVGRHPGVVQCSKTKEPRSFNPVKAAILHDQTTGVLLWDNQEAKIEKIMISIYPIQQKEHRTNLLGCLVKHLALCWKRVRPVHQIVDLLSSLQNRLDCLVLHILRPSHQGHRFRSLIIIIIVNTTIKPHLIGDLYLYRMKTDCCTITIFSWYHSPVKWLSLWTYKNNLCLV